MKLRSCEELTTLQMEIILMKYFDFRRKIIVPNLTDMSLLVKFETDLLVLSKSNYATGVEIKVSKSDLKNDLKKKQYGKYLRNQNEEVYKELYYKPFKYFYYAVPKHLTNDTLKTVHSFCGVLSVDVVNGKPRVKEERKPKLIFNKKWSQAKVMNLLRLGTMRIYKYKNKELDCYER